MAQIQGLPCINRIAFYRLEKGAFLFFLADSVLDSIRKFPELNLSPNHEALMAWVIMKREVRSNGGFTRFFYKNHGARGVEPLIYIFETMNLPNAASLFRSVLNIARKYSSKWQVPNQYEWDDAPLPEFAYPDDYFQKNEHNLGVPLESWFRSMLSDLVADENGDPVDPKYTGTVLSKGANGKILESLEVKRGKPHGRYQKFFDDGMVCRWVLYQSGQITKEFWPDGKVKSSVTKSRGQVFREWFYPNGQILKWMVHGNGGNVNEPICLFHLNGQLAELLTIQDGSKKGPWLQFFEDGKPRLQADYSSDGNQVIHNAWDKEGIKRVNEGTGIFFDDGRDINWYEAPFLISTYEQELELKNHRLHGQVTTYQNGKIRRIRHFVNGVENGISQEFWDNGRIRKETTVVEGVEGISLSFPRIEQPRPAVLLSVEVSDPLISHWNLRKVDEYPEVLNLKEIQKKWEIPDFLNEVHRRNLSKEIKTKAADWAFFGDSVSYIVTVGENGEVKDLKRIFAGDYSRLVCSVYDQDLRELRFRPGRIDGQPRESQVLVSVSHTFVEGDLLLKGESP